LEDPQEGIHRLGSFVAFGGAANFSGYTRSASAQTAANQLLMLAPLRHAGQLQACLFVGVDRKLLAAVGTTRMTQRRLSVLLPPVAKIAVGGALHDCLCAREPHVGAKPLDKREVRAADKQESKLRLAQLLAIAISQH
jgi:hypothetical protein